ncbi:MAG: Gfo/Idh/MocA family protein [Bdellovibrionales bacterium]
MQPGKFALIGLGHISQFQLQALAGLPQWQLVAACDLNPDQQSRLPADTQFYTSADELLANTKAHLIMVATPTPTHFDIGHRVIESGNNLLIEKPICANHVDVERLIELANAKGVHFAVAFHAYHGAEVEWFRQNHASRGLKLEDMIGFKAHVDDPYLENGKLLNRARSLGNAWIDSGINALSVIGSLIPPERLHITSSEKLATPVDGCNIPHARVTFSYNTGTQNGKGTIEIDWTRGINKKATTLYFKDGTEVLLDHSLETVVISEPDQQPEIIKLNNETPRLTNHYTGVLAEAHSNLQRNETNLPFAHRLHNLLFAAFN